MGGGGERRGGEGEVSVGRYKIERRGVVRENKKRG